MLKRNVMPLLRPRQLAQKDDACQRYRGDPLAAAPTRHTKRRQALEQGGGCKTTP